MSKCEIASYSRLQKVDFFRKDWSNTDRYNELNKKDFDIHPCQKPIQLYEWLLMNYAKEGDKIFSEENGNVGGAEGLANVPKGQEEAVVESAEECPGECIMIEP